MNIVSLIFLVVMVASLISMSITLLALIKLRGLRKHCDEAIRIINDEPILERRLELFDFHRPSDIDVAFKYRNAANPFKWSFESYFPRLADEVKRREEAQA